VHQLQQFTSCDVRKAIRVLQENKWNVEVSADLILDGNGLDGDDDDDMDEVKSVHMVDASKFAKIDEWFNSLRDEENSIEANGILKLADQLGIDPETDPVILVLAEVMKAERMLHFSRDEFRRGMSALNCDSSESLKKVIPRLRDSLKKNTRFKELYAFLFKFALDIGQKVMTKEMAVGLWRLLFPGRFALFSNWIDYFEKNHKHGVSKDLWGQFLVFTELPGINQGDFSAFDQIESWPLVLDDFVSALRS